MSRSVGPLGSDFTSSACGTLSLVKMKASLADSSAFRTSATGLPALTVDLHIYANEPAKRAIFINGRRYTQGAHTAEGPIVEEITPDGAILSYHGRRFQLPRL